MPHLARIGDVRLLEPSEHPLGFQRTLANHAGYGSQSYVSVPNTGLAQVSPLVETPVGTLGKTLEYKEYQIAKRNMGQSSDNERASQFDHKSHCDLT
jgi:hypothetical protein